MRREDETEKRYFRCPDRLVQMNGQWYFAAREGDQGPFDTREEALTALNQFIAEKTQLREFQKSRERQAPLADVEEPDDRTPLRRKVVTRAATLPELLI